jgi:ABC-type microcin C transport system permease subunit YejB
MSHNAQNSSTSQSNKVSARYESSSCCDSKIIRRGQKQFCFDLGNNEKGHFLKISEVHYLRLFIIFNFPYFYKRDAFIAF